ncbi:hypothetical protein CNY89_06125 [Amaricoccus sp. HAR-UPW-R2A-40]|nr:hypothetical protein CNY89_06125 [Amaricoccus sp. HAR-UPW-R2A-40]
MARRPSTVLGLPELEKALAELGQRLGATVGYRVLEKVAAPIRDDMIAAAPFDDGVTRDSIKMIRASSERSRLGKAAYSQTLRDGGSIGEARGALRSTMRGLKASSGLAGIIIGPGRAPQALLAEFGTGERFHKNGKSVGTMEAQPYVRPSWDKHAGGLVAATMHFVRLALGLACTAAIVTVLALGSAPAPANANACNPRIQSC